MTKRELLNLLNNIANDEEVLMLQTYTDRDGWAAQRAIAIDGITTATALADARKAENRALAEHFAEEVKKLEAELANTNTRYTRKRAELEERIKYNKERVEFFLK